MKYLSDITPTHYTIYCTIFCKIFQVFFYNFYEFFEILPLLLTGRLLERPFSLFALSDFFVYGFPQGLSDLISYSSLILHRPFAFATLLFTVYCTLSTEKAARKIERLSLGCLAGVAFSCISQSGHPPLSNRQRVDATKLSTSNSHY